MPIDSRSAYQDLLGRTDDLLAKTASRVAASPLAKLAESKTSERLTAIDEAVAATHVDAQSALTKLAEVEQTKVARRAEKVAIVRHIARTAQRLIEV